MRSKDVFNFQEYEMADGVHSSHFAVEPEK